MAWLFVPGLAGLNSASGSWSPITAPSVTWRGKPLARRSWSRVWQTAPFIRHLCGTTYSPSTADAGVDAWISSLPASPVSRGARPASARASRTSGGSGPTSNACFAKYDPASCGWKMCLPLFPEADWPLFCGTWPISGSMRNGFLSEQPTSAPVTSANAFSSWPTVTESDSRSSARHSTTTGVMHPGTMLTDAMRMWRTPDAPNEGGPRNRQASIGQGHQITIAEQAEHWPTPGTTDGEQSVAHKGGNPTLNGLVHAWATPAVPNGGRTTGTTNYTADGRKRQIDLGAQTVSWSTPRSACNVTGAKTRLPFAEGGKTSKPSLEDQAREMWPTPAAEPYGSSQNGINGKGGEHERPSANTPSLDRLSRSFLPFLLTESAGAPSSPSVPTSRPRSKLNPQFVEWLMGWPIGWTASALAATEWCRWQQRMRSALWSLDCATREATT